MTESRMRKIVNRSYVRPMGDLDSSKAWRGYRGSEGRGVAVVKRGVVSEAIATLDDARATVFWEDIKMDLLMMIKNKKYLSFEFCAVVGCWVHPLSTVHLRWSVAGVLQKIPPKNFFL